MRREIKLIIWVFILVVGPAIALSFLAARVLESWQLVLQKRMAGEAGHVLDEAAMVWDRELGLLREKSCQLSATLPPSCARVADLSIQNPWLSGVYIVKFGSELLYPTAESHISEFASSGGDTEGGRCLVLGGIELGKGNTNAAIEWFEQVGAVRNSGAKFGDQNVGEEDGARDPEEGFFLDLVALKKLAEIYEGLGEDARLAEIRAKALERLLSRYDVLVPLQRESLIAWMSEGMGNGGWFAANKKDGKTIRLLLSQWRERMRGRLLGQDERAAWVNGISMMGPNVSDSGWVTMRLKQANLLVTKSGQLQGATLLVAWEYNELNLLEHLNALFSVAASNTEVRVSCQARNERKVGPILASRQLTSPFEAISLVATPQNIPAFMANVRLQTWLYRGGGALLLISVVAGVWLVWREAASEIRQARERSSFAAAVSHDLRTPLSSMRMLAESLYLGNVTDEVKRKKFLGAIIRESDRLGRLTERALYFIRYGQGALRYQFTEGDFGGVVREAVETFAVGVADLKVNGQWVMGNTEEIGGKKKVIIGMEVPGTLPLLQFDAGAMEQVVYNLLDNAVKYSHRDNPGNIRVSVVVEEGKMVLAVEDQGIGMTPAEMRQVLKPYARGGGAKHQNDRGLGLGLALCQHVVQAHGGRIQIRSELGKGTEFKVILPL